MNKLRRSLKAPAYLLLALNFFNIERDTALSKSGTVYSSLSHVCLNACCVVNLFDGSINNKFLIKSFTSDEASSQ
jgi:hypothetical protein